jgi:hypothetical protein
LHFMEEENWKKNFSKHLVKVLINWKWKNCSLCLSWIIATNEINSIQLRNIIIFVASLWTLWFSGKFVRL